MLAKKLWVFTGQTTTIMTLLLVSEILLLEILFVVTLGKIFILVLLEYGKSSVLGGTLLTRQKTSVFLYNSKEVCMEFWEKGEERKLFVFIVIVPAKKV